ncbi:hypothetical protein [Bacillus cereus]|uniref:hypothetical protein n=1 Tax=Bacillus cereus TaxID=1396 RepID=UPI0011A9AF66|nr:hypothetical protein [Bacillus cereus]
MRVYKKLATLAPIAALSTSILCSPAMTFAAEKESTVKQTTQQSAVQQGRTIQGYLIKNGVKIPVYTGGLVTNKAEQGAAAFPQLSSNPNDPIPQKGSISSEDGNIGDILYFSKTPMGDNVYIKKLENNNIEIGTYNRSTLELSKFITTSGDPRGPIMLFDAKVKRETAFEKIGGAVQPKATQYTFSQAVTSGLSTSDAIGGSLTLGYKISLKEGGGVVPAEATQEFSTQLSATYNHTITVTNQTTNTQTQTFKPIDSYGQSTYAAAVYQLKSHYTVIPGAGLQKGLNSGYVLDQTAFSYSDSDLYLAVTPGAGSNV